MILRARPLAIAALFALVGSAAFADDPPATEAPAVETPATGPRSYTLNPATSLVYVQVFKDPDTLASGLSHDHVIKATGFSGTVTWDAADPSTCKVDVTVPVKGLVVDLPEMRKKVGYDSELSESQRADVTKNMLSKEQLDGNTYPNITFKGTKCAASGGSVNVSGTINIRGKDKAITVPMKISTVDKSLSASGTFKVNATDFGFEPYTALLGQLKNKNEMSFTLDFKGAGTW